MEFVIFAIENRYNHFNFWHAFQLNRKFLNVHTQHRNTIEAKFKLRAAKQ